MSRNIKILFVFLSILLVVGATWTYFSYKTQKTILRIASLQLELVDSIIIPRPFYHFYFYQTGWTPDELSYKNISDIIRQHGLVGGGGAYFVQYYLPDTREKCIITWDVLAKPYPTDYKATSISFSTMGNKFPLEFETYYVSPDSVVKLTEEEVKRTGIVHSTAKEGKAHIPLNTGNAWRGWIFVDKITVPYLPDPAIDGTNAEITEDSLISYHRAFSFIQYPKRDSIHIDTLAYYQDLFSSKTRELLNQKNTEL